MPGLKAKSENRVNRVKDDFQFARRDLAGDTVGMVPPELPDAEFFAPQVLRWYDTWCKSPMRHVFSNTDWERLHLLAHVVQSFYNKPSASLMAEIRQNESLLGATHHDRVRMRINVIRPDGSRVSDNDVEKARQAEVTSLRSARMKRMTDAS